MMKRGWERGGIVALAAAGMASAAVYEAIRRVSVPFGLEGNEESRPILAFLAWMGSAFGIYFVAATLAERAATRSHRSAVLVILLFAAAFRVQMLHSEPILERDLHRYLWDGDVGRLGVNPYAFTPEEAAFVAEPARLEEWKRSAEDPERTADGWSAILRLADQLQSDARMRDVLQRVYYPSVPTVYPPVSQCCFRLLAQWTHGLPTDRTAFWFKCGFTGFDLINCGLVVWLCGLCGMPATRCILYAWNPLVVKEIANSGHLDSLAVMLALGGLASAVKFSTCRPVVGGGLAGALLAWSFSAKCFAALVLPLLTWHWIGAARRCEDRSSRRRRFFAIAMAWGTFATVCAACFVPYLAARSAAPGGEASVSANEWGRDAESVEKARGQGGDALRHRQPWTGLTIFATLWEMNSPGFTLVHANLISDGEYAATAPGEPPPWFVLVPNRFRQWLEHALFRAALNSGAAGPAGQTWSSFNAARLALLLVFLAIYSVQCCKCTREEPRQLPARVFQSLAWFWLLSPTLNPWYMTWFLPLLPFVAGHAWRWLPAFAMLYYLRFGFEHQAWTDAPVLNGLLSRYGLPGGVRFFDEAVVFIEFGPWFAWMLWETLRKRGPAVGDSPPG